MSFIVRAAPATLRKQPRKVFNPMRSALLAFLFTWLIGCGSNLASVSGTVTLDGQPLAGSEKLRGTVQFSPESGGGTAAVGYLDQNGRYNLSTGSRVGALPGKYFVSVSATEIIPPQIPGEAPSGRLATPRRYADAKKSGFAAEVASGSNTFDFSLLSHGGK